MKNLKNRKALAALAAVLAVQIAALVILACNIKSFAVTEADMVFCIKGFTVEDKKITANFDYPKPIPEGAKYALVETPDDNGFDDYDYYVSSYNYDCKISGYTDEKPEPGVLYIPVKMLTEPIIENDYRDDALFYSGTVIDTGSYPDSMLEVTVWLHGNDCEIYSFDFDEEFNDEHVHYDWDE